MARFVICSAASVLMRHAFPTFFSCRRHNDDTPFSRIRYLSSSGCTHLYGVITRVAVSLIMCTGGAVRPLRQERHFRSVIRRSQAYAASTAFLIACGSAIDRKNAFG